jgi:hypothetical protein
MVLALLDHASHVRFMRTSRQQQSWAELPEASPVIVVCGAAGGDTSGATFTGSGSYHIHMRTYTGLPTYTRVALDLHGDETCLDVVEAFGALLPKESVAPLSSPLSSLLSSSLSSPLTRTRAKRKRADTNVGHSSGNEMFSITTNGTSFWRLRPRVLDLGSTRLSQTDLEKLMRNDAWVTARIVF